MNRAESGAIHDLTLRVSYVHAHFALPLQVPGNVYSYHFIINSILEEQGKTQWSTCESTLLGIVYPSSPPINLHAIRTRQLPRGLPNHLLPTRARHLASTKFDHLKSLEESCHLAGSPRIALRYYAAALLLSLLSQSAIEKKMKPTQVTLQSTHT